jgi:hypothetical protein
MGSILLDAFICYEFRGISRCAYNYIPKHTLASTVSSLRKKRVSKEGNRKCMEIIEVHQEKCTKLLVQNVEKKQKFLLNQMAQDQFIVGTVFKTC